MKKGQSARVGMAGAAAVAVATVLGFGGAAEAAAITDIHLTASDLKVDYSVGGTNGLFRLFYTVASPKVIQVTNGGVTAIMGSIDLQAEINKATGEFISGSFTITRAMPLPSGDFMKGTLTGWTSNFGAGGTSGQFVFNFNTNPTPAVNFAPQGQVILGVNTLSPGFTSFSQAFASVGNVVTADIRPVPTPAVAASGAALLGGLAMGRRRRPVST